MNILECISVDMDGSLLRTDQTLNPQDVATIHRLREQGVFVFINTGRHFLFAKHIAAQARFGLPAACCNGAHIYDYDTGKTLMAQEMSTSLAVQLIDFMRQRNLPYTIYTDENVYFDSEDNPRVAFWRRECARMDEAHRFEVCVAGDDFNPADHKVLKMLFSEQVEGEIEQLYREFEAIDQLSICKSFHKMYDINPANSTKGTVLEYFSRQYGFELKNTMAIGDQFNDEPMLSIVGYPVVPANGEESIKALARFITTDCNSAPLTHAIAHFFPHLL